MTTKSIPSKSLSDNAGMTPERKKNLKKIIELKQCKPATFGHRGIFFALLATKINEVYGEGIIFARRGASQYIETVELHDGQPAYRQRQCIVLIPEDKMSEYFINDWVFGHVKEDPNATKEEKMKTYRGIKENGILFEEETDLTTFEKVPFSLTSEEGKVPVVPVDDGFMCDICPDKTCTIKFAKCPDHIKNAPESALTGL